MAVQGINTTSILEWVRRNGVIALLGISFGVAIYVNNQERDIEFNTAEIMKLRQDMVKTANAMTNLIALEQRRLADHNVSDAHKGARSRLDKLEVSVEKDVHAIREDVRELKQSNQVMLTLLQKVFGHIQLLKAEPKT